MYEILQHLLKCTLILGGTIGLIFMLGYTIFVVVSIFSGDIRINFIKGNKGTDSKKEK